MQTQTPTIRFDAELGKFYTIKDGHELSVAATRKRNRWQYRAASGALLASGMAPAEFVAQFWLGKLAD